MSSPRDRSSQFRSMPIADCRPNVHHVEGDLPSSQSKWRVNHLVGRSSEISSVSVPTVRNVQPTLWRTPAVLYTESFRVAATFTIVF